MSAEFEIPYQWYIARDEIILSQDFLNKILPELKQKELKPGSALAFVAKKISSFPEDRFALPYNLIFLTETFAAGGGVIEVSGWNGGNGGNGGKGRDGNMQDSPSKGGDGGNGGAGGKGSGGYYISLFCQNLNSANLISKCGNGGSGGNGGNGGDGGPNFEGGKPGNGGIGGNGGNGGHINVLYVEADYTPGVVVATVDGGDGGNGGNSGFSGKDGNPAAAEVELSRGVGGSGGEGGSIGSRHWIQLEPGEFEPKVELELGKELYLVWKGLYNSNLI